MSYIKSKIYSQNFLKDTNLVNRLITESGISKDDTVVEIGAGKGIITSLLAEKAKKVIAVEIDPVLAKELRATLSANLNVNVYTMDIRQFKLPDYPYKVFSNVPFSITADIMYKLLYYSNSPTSAFLIVQKEAAEKLVGIPKETQFSLLAKVWFDFSINYKFKRTDFSPMPDVDTVLLCIKKRQNLLLSKEDQKIYGSFIKYGFNTWKKDLKVGFKGIFTYNQWKRLACEYKFRVHSKPSDLTFEQWYKIFLYFKTDVVDKKKLRIMK